MKRLLLTLFVFSFSFSIGIDKFAHLGISYMSQDLCNLVLGVAIDTENVTIENETFGDKVVSKDEYVNDVSLLAVVFVGLAKEIMIDSQASKMDMAFNVLGAGTSWLVNGGKIPAPYVRTEEQKENHLGYKEKNHFGRK